MSLRPALAVAILLVSAAPAWAADGDLARSKPQAAQVVTLARLASVLCPEVDVDEAAVHALMDAAGITDRDIVDPEAYGSGDTVVARSFARSFADDAKDACSKLLWSLGPEEGRLLHRAGKPV